MIMEEKFMHIGDWVFLQFDPEKKGIIIKHNIKEGIPHDETSYLVEFEDDTRSWHYGKSLDYVSNLSKKELLISFDALNGFTLHFNNLVADRLNFEEMLGCVIRVFEEQRGDAWRYFENAVQRVDFENVE
jgi:hypothetical protein